MKARLHAIVLAVAVVAPGAVRAQRDSLPVARPLLEQRFRDRIAGVLQRRLDLSDRQLAQLDEVERRLAPRRAELLDEERRVRRGMRDALESAATDEAVQARVATLLDRALQVQRRRLELHESEQRELATVLTPVQRARYFGLMEQMRRRADALRRGPDDGPPLEGPDDRRGARRRPPRLPP